MNDIKVKVTKYADRKFWIMYYNDPITNKLVPRSTRKTSERDANREAAKWEAELREGRYHQPSNITWEEFRQRYEDEVLTSLAESTDGIVGTVFNHIEAIIASKMLRDLTAERLSHYQSVLRKPTPDRKTPRSEATISCYLAHLRAALQWAVNMEMLRAVPKIQKPKRVQSGKVMKGRPITLEEFERIISKVEDALSEPIRKAKPDRGAA